MNNFNYPDKIHQSSYSQNKEKTDSPQNSSLLIKNYVPPDTLTAESTPTNYA